MSWLISLTILVNSVAQLIGWFDVRVSQSVSQSVTEAEWYVFNAFSDLYPNAMRVIERDILFAHIAAVVRLCSP